MGGGEIAVFGVLLGLANRFGQGDFAPQIEVMALGVKPHQQGEFDVGKPGAQRVIRAAFDVQKRALEQLVAVLAARD